MKWRSSKGNQPFIAYPRNLSWIAVSVGGLALFLVLGSLILVSNPLGLTVRGYFNVVDGSKQLDLSPYMDSSASASQFDNVEIPHVPPGQLSDPGGVDRTFPSEPSLKESELEDQVMVLGVSNGSSTDGNVSEPSPKVNVGSPSLSSLSDAKREGDGLEIGALPSNTTDNVRQSNHSVETKDISSSSFESNSGSPSNKIKGDSGCDLYNGTWVFDPLGPLYCKETCPVLSERQNCQGNGRPDKDYEYWRWKPEMCDLPRFNARKFLELMKGKAIGFIGDSVARNQMESLLCMLWQEEVPKNRGNKKMQRYYFRSTSTMVIRIWSSWLVKETLEPLNFAPGIKKVHLDLPSDDVMEHIADLDVIVLSSGHWFAKDSVYLLNNETVGGQQWSPKDGKPMKINNVEAFGISVETILNAIATHPGFKGLVIVRSYSPDHYDHGAWNTGGSCTGKTVPLAPGKVVENVFTNAMHEKQITSFSRVAEKTLNRVKMIFMDITRAFEYRHDGHPGPYRSTDPNKLTHFLPNGKAPPQDCLHWCMPGPVDTWNEILLELLRREFEGNKEF